MIQEGYLKDANISSGVVFIRLHLFLLLLKGFP